MVFKYDDFFNWLKTSDWKPETINVKQDVYFMRLPGEDKMKYHALLQIPDSIVKLEFHGLEKLQNHNLIIGRTSRVNGNQKGDFVGKDATNLEELGVFNMQVFELVDGQTPESLVEGNQYNLVARISAVPGGTLKVEFCANAPKYLGI
jgi:hypothetical protein